MSSQMAINVPIDIYFDDTLMIHSRYTQTSSLDFLSGILLNKSSTC